LKNTTLSSTQRSWEGVKLSSRGCAIAQVVSRWLPTAVARVRSCGICDGQSDTGAGFLRVLRFPLTLIPPIVPCSSLSGAGTVCQIVANMPSGLSHPTP
jgi:hypothetical protein